MEKGKVYLVGAGPGDPKLITVRGLEALKRADVVVFDRLAGPHLINHARSDAERIYVGKLPDRHTMKQEEINRLLVDLALQGKTVVRLKGGDPTVFGRVGEEAELLRRNGIIYEIIPGITSAIAVPAYAGIPVTHRDLASSFSVITGHESPDKLDHSIYWDKVTNATGTLVFLMGVAKIGYISEQLIRHGRPPETPVALVRWGTRAEQRTVVGTLGDIEEKVKAANLQPPAVIVVGEVVKQRETLAWVESKPLFGRRVLVTRARSQASELVARIDELGGEAYEFPVIETKLPEGKEAEEAIGDALARAEEYDWVMLTSVNGVDYFFRWLDRFGVDVRRFHRAKFAAVGPKTADALALRGIRADLLPESFRAEGLLDRLADQVAEGQIALLPRGDLARKILPEELRAKGVRTVEIDVYDTELSVPRDIWLPEMLENGEIHTVTFTSSSTVVNLLEALRRLGVEDPQRALARSEIACIGPVTAKTAEEHGLKVSIMPDDYTIEGLVQALIERGKKGE
ncbi:uroporphyrinogen-III C-methyltransferase [Cohnella sp. CIP 111063]|uniref:uroporphyrinogen-III C-methyltransferase n=1 Tax=unclassified Cohnella TaxID=2636738 RepID=UPI000B8BD662|nr:MULTISPECIES: uroporphyrinogen-III C-methyltransferase [unclassified Cohnella]OXS57926.1 uroporphyrinogen-III C-methyltransferase [Cohnella sp. CIP 111063]PRX71251.1 uroporphyrinogen III methyltransferase/synthase [Cohnella sp. SGD-V74]